MREVMSQVNQYISIVFVLVGSFLFAKGLPKRKLFPLRVSIIAILNAFFVFAWSFFFNNFNDSPILILSCSRYIIQYCFALSFVLFAFKCGFVEAVYCATCGYCLQQIAARFTGLCIIFIDVKAAPYIGLLFYGLSAVFYVVMVFFVIRGKFILTSNLEINSPLQLLLSTAAMFIIIIVEAYMMNVVRSLAEPLQKASEYLKSTMFSILILVLELNLVRQRRAEKENAVITKMLGQDKMQYEAEEKIVTKLNIIAHDLKHQLGKSNELSEEAQEAVEIYDSMFKTGNKGLDIILTMKNQICKQNDIELTCLINGKDFLFMSESETYSLFGNILDNAVEAVLKLEDIQKRVISIVSYRSKNQIVIHEENYFDGEVTFKDGLPKTTKGNEDIHGFGVKSISLISKKYKGEVSFYSRDDVFSLDILFDDKKIQKLK